MGLAEPSLVDMVVGLVAGQTRAVPVHLGQGAQVAAAVALVIQGLVGLAAMVVFLLAAAAVEHRGMALTPVLVVLVATACAAFIAGEVRDEIRNH